MSSASVVDPEAIATAFDAAKAALDGLAALDCDALTTPESLESLERCEHLRRRIPSLEHEPINHLARQATPEELGDKLPPAFQLRIAHQLSAVSHRP